jgi:hypothetical protein
VWTRTCQAGDAGSTVTIPATTVGKARMTCTAIAGPATVGPVAVAASVPEATAQTTHASPTPTNPSSGDPGFVMQFYAAKDGSVSSSARSISTGYTVRDDYSTAAASFAFVSMVATKNTGQAAGVVPAATWTADQATATAVMGTLVVAPASSTVALKPGVDLTVPAGATIVGGTTMSSVWADSDPATLVKVPLSGTAKTAVVRWVGSDGGVPPGPLKHFDVDVQCAPGTATLSMVAKLLQGTTVLHTYTAFATVNTSGVATFSQDVAAGDQTAQTNLSDIRLELDFTGS